MRFSSGRERRLWAWTLVVLVAIFGTLGVAQSLAGVLRDQELIGAAFSLSMFLIGAAIVVVALRVRPSWVQIGVGLGVAAVYLLLLLRMAIPEERSHLIEYSVVALLIHEALFERQRNGGRVRFVGLTAFVATTLIGVLDETVQLFLPTRFFDPIDMLFNAIAAALAVGAVVLLRWVRR